MEEEGANRQMGDENDADGDDDDRKLPSRLSSFSDDGSRELQDLLSDMTPHTGSPLPLPFASLPTPSAQDENDDDSDYVGFQHLALFGKRKHPPSSPSRPDTFEHSSYCYGGSVPSSTLKKSSSTEKETSSSKKKGRGPYQCQECSKDGEIVPLAGHFCPFKHALKRGKGTIPASTQTPTLLDITLDSSKIEAAKVTRTVGVFKSGFSEAEAVVLHDLPPRPLSKLEMKRSLEWDMARLQQEIDTLMSQQDNNNQEEENIEGDGSDDKSDDEDEPSNVA